MSDRKMLECEEFLKDLDERISTGENWDKDYIFRKSKESIQSGEIQLLDTVATRNLDNNSIYVDLYKTFIKIECDSMKSDICRTYYFFMVRPTRIR